jgi:hypothetical protein
MDWLEWLEVLLMTVIASVICGVLHVVAYHLLDGIDVKSPMLLKALIVMPTYIVTLALSVLIHLALLGRQLGAYTHDWFSKQAGVFVVLTAIPALVLLTWLAALPLLDAAKHAGQAAGGAVWIATTLWGIAMGNSPFISAAGGKWWQQWAVKAVPIIFVAGLLVLLVAGLEQILAYFADLNPPSACTLSWLGSCISDNAETLESVGWKWWGTLTVATFALGALFAWRVDVNLFSFHSYYRNRLIQAYLAASRSGHERKPYPFTQHDPDDSVSLEDMVTVRPYPIINTTLNLTDVGDKLDWQQRKAASFVFTPRYCGYQLPRNQEEGDYHAYQKTNQFLHKVPDQHRPITQGFAMTVSGAAASPNMGYHTSAGIALLLTLFNVRLGWWLENPGSSDTWGKPGPVFSLWYLMWEFFGRIDEKENFVYLSDGGHFDNLGLYELVRRRCRLIVVSDASADPTFQFDDLADTLRKIRVDLNVPIDLDPSFLRPAESQSAQPKTSPHNWAVGKIRYSVASHDKNKADADGILIYIKASLPTILPPDLYHYAATHRYFPHQSTSDQWFDEAQFEAYRLLGFTIANALGKRVRANRPSDWADAEYWERSLRS